MATIIATALQGSVSDVFVIPNGNPAHVRFDMVSPSFPTTPGLSFDFVAEESFDNGAHYSPYLHSAFEGGHAGEPIGKFGAIIDGLWHQAVQWDGLARWVRVTITVNTPFVWGLTGVVI